MKYLLSFMLTVGVLSATSGFTGCGKPKNVNSEQEETPKGIEYRTEISQYGITWTFKEPAQVGRFITGDWWVVGPVEIIRITPSPGPGDGQSLEPEENVWGDTGLQDDNTMRNGSMIVLQVGTRHGYDSRSKLYDSRQSLSLPIRLEPNRTLISSASTQFVRVDNFATEIMWASEKKINSVLKTIAVLTCLSEVPPADAFRPPYVGTDKPIFQAKDVDWNKLPKLSPAGTVPSWQLFERYLERPWIDHLMTWQQQEITPHENGPNYGREHSRIISIAGLMVMLDVPKEQRETLTLRLIQRGIDLYGIAKIGGNWNEGGGHSSGRKWPILFASLILNKPEIYNLPETAVFQEDTQTYFGNGWAGQKALYWMIKHHGIRERYEEKHPSTWEQWDRTTENYRVCCNGGAWIGTALAARYMKAIKLWGHDAHFDYVDRWMQQEDAYRDARGSYPRPSQEAKSIDAFVTAMWLAHRNQAPEQETSSRHRKWVWRNSTVAEWVDNPKQ